MATSFLPSTARTIPGSLVTALVEEMGFKIEHVVQMWIAHQGITVSLHIPLNEASINEMVKEYPGLSLHGDSHHVETQVSFRIDWEASDG